MYIKKIQIRIDRRILPNRHRQDINPPVGEPNTPVSKYSGKTSLTQACICNLHTHSKTPAFFPGSFSIGLFLFDCVTKSKIFRSIRKRHTGNFAGYVTNRKHSGK